MIIDKNTMNKKMTAKIQKLNSLFCCVVCTLANVQHKILICIPRPLLSGVRAHAAGEAGGGEGVTADLSPRVSDRELPVTSDEPALLPHGPRTTRHEVS